MRNIKITVPARDDMLMEYVYYGTVIKETDVVVTIQSGHVQATFAKKNITMEEIVDLPAGNQ